jgi:very-short-patch-repair endonuclease
MMSPLSVAHFLPADRYQFDVVIFDEASQVRPHDAIGAIMRGRQLIVAGDSKQLPPTSFFDRAVDDVDDDDNLDMRAMESILDALNAKGMPQKSLLWHYRSRHEDLIAYSNHHFYERRLITFPSPGAAQSMMTGVRLDFVPDGRYVDERDRVLKTPIRVNRIEARRVAKLVMEHARTRPKESLLVVTLGMRQREVVEEEIAKARALEQDLEEFFNKDNVEPFEVKPLEQIQGDERDVIFISVGYGKNADGVLSHNFGPINLQGGERRLNVLVTRARNQVVLVSSIRYTDIDPNRTQNLGPALLRNYLEFAERGPLALNSILSSSDGEYESPFEEQVGEALKRAGYDVHRQVGTSKYRIDLAIVDPRDPGRYLLGIECDGKTYHQSKTARDRDRLRQEVLESLGWQIHRIWSTEWTRNPERELERVLARIKELLGNEISSKESESGRDDRVINAPIASVAVSNSNEVESMKVQHHVPVADVSVVMDDAISAPYQFADFSVPLTEIWETPISQVMQAVVQCVEAEGPIHQELLQRRLASLWGYQRAGSRITRKIEEATQLAVHRGQVRKKNAFLWPLDEREIVPRRASEDGDVRQIAHIPDEEIARALRAILARAMSLTPDELVMQGARAFGYQRTGPDIRAKLLRVAREMHQTGSVDFRDGRIQVGQ